MAVNVASQPIPSVNGSEARMNSVQIAQRLDQFFRQILCHVFRLFLYVDGDVVELYVRYPSHRIARPRAYRRHRGVGGLTVLH